MVGIPSRTGKEIVEILFYPSLSCSTLLYSSSSDSSRLARSDETGPWGQGWEFLKGVQLQWANGFYSLSTGIIPNPMSSCGWRIRTWGPRSVSNSANIFPFLSGSEVYSVWLDSGSKPWSLEKDHCSLKRGANLHQCFDTGKFQS